MNPINKLAVGEPQGCLLENVFSLIAEGRLWPALTRVGFGHSRSYAGASDQSDGSPAEKRCFSAYEGQCGQSRGSKKKILSQKEMLLLSRQTG
jgi:hypothetical protein